MHSLDLSAHDDLGDCLPMVIGDSRLVAIAPQARACIAPFQGQRDACEALMQARLQTGLPDVGCAHVEGEARVQWFGYGKWLVSGVAPEELIQTFNGICAVTDQSDALTGVILSGDVEQVMARLCSLDIHSLADGQTAITEVDQVVAVLTRIGASIEILLPRSSARWTIDRIHGAMKSVAARARV